MFITSTATELPPRVAADFDCVLRRTKMSLLGRGSGLYVIEVSAVGVEARNPVVKLQTRHASALLGNQELVVFLVRTRRTT